MTFNAATAEILCDYISKMRGDDTVLLLARTSTDHRFILVPLKQNEPVRENRDFWMSNELMQELCKTVIALEKENDQLKAHIESLGGVL